jgi:hypothetical protein
MKLLRSFGHWNGVILEVERIIFFFCITGSCVVGSVEGFVPVSHHEATATVVVSRPIPSYSTTLYATKKKEKKRSSSRNNSSGGFGGAAMESCPCGSGETYSTCCGKLHRDVNSYRIATPAQIVRARYSAYAKKQPEFLMASTHPRNINFDTDLKRWKDSIK